MVSFKKTVEQSEPTLLLPNLYAVYNAGSVGVGNLAAYVHAGITAGGGTLKWDDGTVSTQGYTSGGHKASVEASSVYYGVNIGVAYASADNTVAVSAGIRTLMPKRSVKISDALTSSGVAEGKIEYDAIGCAPIIGLAVKPMKDLTIALRYEFETDLEFKYSISGNPVGRGLIILMGYKDGMKNDQNLPAMAAIGLEYKASSELTVLFSFNKYYLSQAYNVNLGDDDFRSGWEASIGATYQVMPELKVGAGFMYNDIGVEKDIYDLGDFFTISTNPPLNSISIAIGGTYVVMPGLDLTLACSWTHYLPESYDFQKLGTIKGEYRKEVYDIAIGVGYKAF